MANSRRDRTSRASEPRARHWFEPNGERKGGGRRPADAALDRSAAAQPARSPRRSNRWRARGSLSLAELNAAIRELLGRFNAKVTRHPGASRRDLFEQLDRPALKPLPVEPYEYAEWQERRVGLDYHVEIDKHYYSVPHQLLKTKLWARMTAGTVEIFHDGQRVASHVRTSANRQHTTVPEHMPAR